MNKHPQRIQSLDRGLRIMEFVADQNKPVRLAQLAELLEIEKSSVYRLAATLAERNYLRQDAESSGYVLSDKVFNLAGKLASQRSVQQHARKYLQQLAQKTGETSHLAIRSPAGATFVDHEFGSHPIAVITQSGQCEPYHCTAIGKALLAGLPQNELKDIIGSGRLKRYGTNTITCLRDLAKACNKVADTELAFDLEDFRPGMNCIASPVYDFRKQVVAAIGISGPATRLKNKSLNIAAKQVKNCAAALSAELGA